MGTAPPRPLQGDTLGQRIAAALAWSGTTKAEVARHCHVAWQTVHKWIDDIHAPDLEHLIAVSEITAIPLEEIVQPRPAAEPRHSAWRAFASTPEAESMTPHEDRAMRALVWPVGCEPSVASYQIVLAAMRATCPAAAAPAATAPATSRRKSRSTAARR